LTFVKTGVKTKNGNTSNEKAVFFKGMGTTVNEDELRDILAREGKSKQSIPTPKTNQKIKLTKVKQTYTQGRYTSSPHQRPTDN
jgi:hypothetical protein